MLVRSVLATIIIVQSEVLAKVSDSVTKQDLCHILALISRRKQKFPVFYLVIN
jgi:hypothetical protein